MSLTILHAELEFEIYLALNCAHMSNSKVWDIAWREKWALQAREIQLSSMLLQGFEHY